MSFSIHLHDEPLVELTALAEAELVAYGIGREHGIEHVKIWFKPNADQSVGETKE